MSAQLLDKNFNARTCTSGAAFLLPSQLRFVGWFQTPSQWCETEKFGVHNQKSLAQKNWLGPNEALAFTIEYAEDSAGLWFTLKPPHNGGKLQSFAFTTKNLWHKKTALARMKG